ncbi:uncharacterized protein LOC108820084 [Raphanus sativus]|uniref:Uncharacterized protein LOC108820084 n=1 Tax=Raphanus sativus TaxID=3726 RepID=A0A9W3CBL8_RAPSA|nr:uncharacterized protein LOC108820084 [Raphanus sativus]
MGNNNATANLTEEESPKLETNGISPLGNVPVETTQDQVFLVGEGKDGDKQRESFSDGTPETEPQSKELDKDPQVTNVEEDMTHKGLVMETDEQLHENTSVAKGVEPLCVSTKVEELSIIATQSVEKKLNAEEYVNEDKPIVCDEIVFVSPGFNETAGTEEKLVMNESLEETSPAGNGVELDQAICMEQRKGFPEIQPQEILNLENRVTDDEDEGEGDKEISKRGLQGSNTTEEIGFEDYKEERVMELAREASLKRMSRCRSLPVSNSIRVKGDSPVKELVSEVTYPSRNKTGFLKAKTSDILPVSCQTSKEVQETTEAINESSKEAKLEMRSLSFSNDLRIHEKSAEPTEETLLLSQDKTETYKATLDNVEDKTVMLKRSETEKIRGFELSLGLSMNLSGRCDTDESFKETEGSGDNLEDKKANRSETLFVSCVGSSKVQEATEVITESNKEDLPETRSPCSGNGLRTKERSGESTEHIPLLCQDKTETYDATIGVEKKTVMLKRSESEKTRGFELSLGLSMKRDERSEADDSLKENKDSGENLLDKKASWSSMKGRVRKRSKSSLFGTCLCCNTAMN